MDRSLCRLLVVGCLLFATLPAGAGTTGQLAGRVLDESGAPLPGVPVEASSPSQIGGVQLTETDATGRFLYPRLSPGIYTVRIEVEGYVIQELTQVQVRLDRLTELQISLVPASFSDEITVTETTPVVDPAQVSTGQTFTSEYLQKAAVGRENRQYLGMLPQTAGVERQGDLGIRVLGSSPMENTFLVDGSDTTDPYDKGATLLTLSFEAIDEIAFHTAGFEAEYGGATGGVVNLVTKAGGNRFSGSLDFRYGSDRFSSSGDHHDPDEEPFDIGDVNGSLGGPIVRDRLWFFAAAQSFRNRYTPTGAPSTVDWNEQNYLGKLTWQVGPSWTIAGRIIGNPATADHFNASQFRSPEAESAAEWTPFNGHLEATAVLSNSLLFGIKASAQDAVLDLYPRDWDLTTISHYNYYTGESYGNFSFQNYDERRRRDLETDLTWFVDDFGGSHEIKAGLTYVSSSYRSDYCYSGTGRICTAGDYGHDFGDITDGGGNNIPYDLWVQQAAGPQDFTGPAHSVYLQDIWRIRPDLTFKAGLRWDRARQENDVGQEIADLALLQPRVGVAWDILGDGRNILRASWGRYMHPSRLLVAEWAAQKASPWEVWLSCSTHGGHDQESCFDAARFWQYSPQGFRSDPEGWDPVGWFLDPENVFADENRTSPDLEPMYADQLVLAYERELFRRTSMEVSYVNKDTTNLMEDTCNGNVPTPHAGAACDYWLLTNMPGASNEYKALMLRLESRARDRFHLVGSYVNSDSKGFGGGELQDEFDIYPYHFVNRYGYLQDHSRHRVKLSGFAILPLDFSVALSSWWSSEFRWTPVTSRHSGPYGRMYLEPRGNRSEPGVYQVDLQVGKGFTWGRTHLQLFGTIYNLLSSESANEVCTNDTGCGGFDMGDPIKWQLPRRYELGVRVEF